MSVESLSTLEINKLSQKQFDREFAAGNLKGTALYLTPDNSITIWKPDTKYMVGDCVLGFKVSGVGNNQTDHKLFIFECKQDHISSSGLNDDTSYWKETPIVVDASAKDGLGNFIVDTYATKKEIGDIETALDNIIAIQNMLMGGANE